MSEQGDFQLYLKGDRRSDGWKSQWRRDLERRMAEDRVRVIVKAPQIKARQERQPKIKRPKTSRETKYGLPIGLTSFEWQRMARKMWRDAGLCGSCGKPAIEGRYSCADCIERKARYYCKRVGKEYTPQTFTILHCRQCGKALNSNNKYGWCTEHYRANRRELRRVRQPQPCCHGGDPNCFQCREARYQRTYYQNNRETIALRKKQYFQRKRAA